MEKFQKAIAAVMVLLQPNFFSEYSTETVLTKVACTNFKLQISTFEKKIEIQHYARGQWENFKSRSSTLMDLFNRTFSTNSLW